MPRCTAKRGSLRDSASLATKNTQHFSKSKTVSFSDDTLEPADRIKPRRATRANNVPQILAEARTKLAVTEIDNVEPKTVDADKQADYWDQCHQAVKNEVKALQTSRIRI